MTQQRKTRPTRAARARQKTRTPNIPQEGAAGGRDVTPLPAREPAPTGAPAPVAFSRTTHRPAPVAVQDYSYVRRDLVRIAKVSSILLALMAVLAFMLR